MKKIKGKIPQVKYSYALQGLKKDKAVKRIGVQGTSKRIQR